MSNSGGRSGVTGSDENNTCDLNGTQCPRLPSSVAGQGAYVNGGSNYTYSHGLNTGALATVLPSLAGTPIQTGALRGQLWEGFVQDQVDVLAAHESWQLRMVWCCGRDQRELYLHGPSTAQWGYLETGSQAEWCLRQQQSQM